MPSAVIINDTRVDQHHGCTRVMRAILELGSANGVDIVGTAPAHSDWRANKAFTEAFERADIVIVNGEGTIHHSRPAAIPLLAAGARAKELGKRSVLLNFSWFENDAAIERALRDFDLVSARESMSQEAIRQIRPDCWLVPDLSLCGPVADGIEREAIGFGDSVNAADSMALDRLRERFNGRFAPIITPKHGVGGALGLARFFLADHGADDPRPYRFRIAQTSAHVRERVGDSDSFLSLLASFRLLVTGRFHGVTLALCAGTPVLAVSSNTPKIEAVLGDAGLAHWRVTRPQDIDEQLIEKAAIWHQDERENAGRYVASAYERAQQLFRDIASLA